MSKSQLSLNSLFAKNIKCQLSKSSKFDEFINFKYDILEKIQNLIENMPTQKKLELLQDINGMITNEINKIKKTSPL